MLIYPQVYLQGRDGKGWGGREREGCGRMWAEGRAEGFATLALRLGCCGWQRLRYQSTALEEARASERADDERASERASWKHAPAGARELALARTQHRQRAATKRAARFLSELIPEFSE